MIKCYFVDVKNISSTLPRSMFVDSEIEQLADAILATDGLLRPLILKEIGVEKYTVIEGHREYYAAVRAKEKNLAKAEMVNAFAIDTNTQQSAIEQLTLLSADRSSNIDESIGDSLSLARLLPAIEATLSAQLKPVLDRLAQHTEILEILSSKSIDISKQKEAEPTTIQPIVTTEISQTSDILPTKPEPVEIAPKTTTKSTATNKKTAKGIDIPAPISSNEDLATQPDPKPIAPKRNTKSTPNKKTAKAIDTPPPPIASDGDLPKQIESKEIEPQKATKSTSKSKASSDFLASIDPIKATNTLKLINTQSQQQLTVSMERSGLKTSVKFVPSIIEYRNTQPEQIIDSWDTLLNAKITGLVATAIKKIIEKLK
jgi:hypothetical protein